MSFIDLGSGARVVELIASENYPDITLSPSYSAPNFTRAFDARPYMSALIVLQCGNSGTGVTADFKLQQAAEPAFDTWEDIPGATFTQLDPDNDQLIYVGYVDLKHVSNAVGAYLDVVSGGNRIVVGVTAILFPQDTANATDMEFRI